MKLQIKQTLTKKERPIKEVKIKKKIEQKLIVAEQALIPYNVSDVKIQNNSVFDILQRIHPDIKDLFLMGNVVKYKTTCDYLEITQRNDVIIRINPLKPLPVREKNKGRIIKFILQNEYTFIENKKVILKIVA